MKPSRILSLAILLALPALAREPDIGVQASVMVPMRDGAKLATNIYLPAGNSAKLPVILTRLPCNKDGAKKPGETYPFTIKLHPTSNAFKKEHRIRVDISSSSNVPRFGVNPNTGEPLNDHCRVQTAVDTILHDQARPSHIVLPVIPR